jgi:hypothetical protein
MPSFPTTSGDGCMLPSRLPPTIQHLKYDLLGPSCLPILDGVPEGIFYKFLYALQFYDWFIPYTINEFICDEGGG